MSAFECRCIMFAVHDLGDLVTRLQVHEDELVGKVVRFGEIDRIAYIRGAARIIVGLAEVLGSGLSGSRDRTGGKRTSVASKR